ncbi:MAG TPA: N-6 DNA methylase [Candidatus Marinimicrobia bacterium]|nr:N-6 DNA methylase [Candidatus Neomarinimicrobiota bacterium]HRS51431.1 N-6 DNA methylase [Candidatus Neomarinimicrobiota bacterium]
MPEKNYKLADSVNHDSLPILADNLISGTKNLLRDAKTEEDLRIGFEKLLEPIRSGLNLNYTPKYEKSVYSGRSDAVHGQLIIEYELPMSFSSKKNIDHAYEQLINYLSDAAKETKSTQFVGVGFDGEQIFFVQYKNNNSKEIDKKKFLIRGPYEFNPKSARTFLIHLRALSRLPLTAENLAQKFGPQSEIAPKIVSALANALEYWGDQTHIRTFFNEWKRLFGIVYGEQFTGSPQEKEAATLSKLYNVGRETDFQELLFSVHTYFALLMKLIATELLTLQETSFSSSLTSQLTHIADDEFKRQLEDIENGGIYARKGITNFLEGDFFCWYLDALDSPELKYAIREIARALSEFEPATSTLDPVSTRDLLKKLYQYLVPQEVRHRLGEYYTPDWLAELLLNEVGYDGDTRKRFLDPACGSGTFLVLAIQRAKEHGQKEKLQPLEIAKRIVANIWGFDLNPLAVIAARTNYLFALGDLANKLENFEIPIYLADSILWPQRTGQMTIRTRGESIEIPTSLKSFYVPSIWISNKGFLMRKAAPLIEEMVKNQYSVNEAMERFRKEGLVFPPHEKIVEEFYKEIFELEKQKKNGIWARFLKNAFAPMVAGKFDFVVGNPPWIRWDYLSQEYRNATLQLWKDYRLFSLKGFQTRLGGGKKDFSMLFVYASADYYLKDGAKLGFLITQEVLKSKGAGEGFRRFQLGENKYLKVLKAHDLVSIQPFEGAANKTAAIILKKGEKTEYPLPYFIWTKKKGVGKIATDKLLDEVSPLLQKKKYNAKPISSNVGAWQTQLTKEKGVATIKGKNFYKAILGANPNPYGVFWLEIKQVLSDGNLIIRNLTEKGKLKIQQVEEIIEQDLVYPAIRGSDIERWKVEPRIFMLVVQDPKTRRGYTEDFIRKEYPRTYSYLLKFKDILLCRPLYKKYHEQVSAPFYSQFNISEETFFRYKVVWKRMTNDLIAAVISQFKTQFGYKSIIPFETTAFIATQDESEAHYLCAIINSTPVRDFIKSFSSAGRGFGTPSVMEHVGIPKFDPQNPLHQKLAEISKKCHQLKTEGKEKEIEKLEKENDDLVKKLFQINY